MKDATSLLLQINPPATIENVVYKALQAEPSRPEAVALFAMAQFYNIFERFDEAEAVFKTALHVAIAACGEDDRLVRQIKGAFDDFESGLRRGIFTIWRSCVDEPRSILRGPDRTFLTHEPPKSVAGVIFDCFEAEPSLFNARHLQALAAQHTIHGHFEEAEALLLAALEVANNANLDEKIMGELFEDFDKLLEENRKRLQREDN